MLKKSEIKKIFKKMGLGSEEERKRFAELGKWDLEEDKSNKHIFITTTTTLKVEGQNNAELA